MELLLGDCLDILPELQDDSVDLLFCDLPYGQTSCKWDCLIDLDEFWKQVNRICKIDSPMIFTCSVKFGNSLINSNPKNFRYDLIWEKSRACGFLNAKKMPMKKHEMIYVFYRKLSKVYTENISLHHSHKFLKETENKRKESGKGCYTNGCKTETSKKYDPPLPVSMIKENENIKYDRECNSELYGEKTKRDNIHKTRYDPPLPVSMIKENENIIKESSTQGNTYNTESRNKPIIRSKPNQYDPPLPNSMIKDEVYNQLQTGHNPNNLTAQQKKTNIYEPELPNSILKMKSEGGKHSTQKPVALMEFILKYYSRENDVILDPTMGSGSMGCACKTMNRIFIGIEKDDSIFEVAMERLND